MGEHLEKEFFDKVGKESCLKQLKESHPPTEATL